MIICPSCNGPHLEGLRFQHKSICDFYLAEAQTQAADHERFRANRGQPITRSATDAEVLLLEALGEDGEVTITTTFHGAIWQRTTNHENEENDQ